MFPRPTVSMGSRASSWAHSPNQVTTQDQATFASMLDREHLDVAEPKRRCR